MKIYIIIVKNIHIRGGIISTFRHRDGTHIVIVSLYDEIYESVFHFHHIEPEFDTTTRTRARNRFGPYLGVSFAAEPQEVALREKDRNAN